MIANHRIRVPRVRVLSDQGETLGIMDTRDALALAQEQHKDLVLVTEKADPPVTKIIELAKFKYQQQQREAESRKKARAQDIKEVRFTPFMGANDFEARLNKVKQFLKKGDKVRLSLMFKGRAITKKEFGFEMITRVIEATDDIAVIESPAKMMGNKLIAQLMPGKKGQQKDKEQKQQETSVASATTAVKTAPENTPEATNTVEG